MTPNTLVSLSLATLLLPLAGFLLLIFFGKKMPRQGDWLGLGLLIVCLVLALTIFFEKLTSFPDPITWNFSWVNFGNVPGFGPLQIVLGLTIDNLTAIMLVVVTLVSTLVHLFSTKYMEGDIRYSRYFAYLGIFTFSMLVIVLTNNFFLIYVGWELVGLSSYLLIGHWFEKKSASDASKKAFVTNRVGDIGMFTGIMILYYTFHTFGFTEIFNAMAQGTIPMGSEKWLTAAGILIFCGAVGKSAQFPLHVWLPDAMEGPTPVSALIHAATMVAAGVYLIARAYPIFTADALLVIAYIGAITAFISATIALVQNDIKKVLAYSTISQLGYMVMGLGVGAYTAGFFHLVTHAMFKAGLFLGSGSVIHAMHHALHHENDHHTDPQDIRNMGGLKAKMPVTFYAFLMYTLAISGVPFTSGFLSKDEILAGTLAFGSLTGHYLIPIIGYFVAGLTTFYMFRIVILAFLGDHANAKRYGHIRESPAAMLIPLIVFAVLSFFAFYSFNPFGAADGWFYHTVVRPESSVPQSVRAAGIEQFEDAVHAAHIPAMALSLTFAGLGILLAFMMYKWKRVSADDLASRFSGVHKFLMNKWYFDELYEFAIVGGCKGLANLLNVFDAKVVDGFVNGTATWTMGLVHGSGNAWKEKTVASRIYLYVGLFVAAVVAVATYQWLAPGQELIAIVRSGVGAMCVGVLTLFFFWKGAGGFDTYVVDGLVNGTAYSSGFFGIVLRKLQTGRIQTYLIFVVVATMVLFFAFR